MPGLSEESLSGLGAEKPGPYKEMLIRNEENNEINYKKQINFDRSGPKIHMFSRRYSPSERVVTVSPAVPRRQ